MRPVLITTLTTLLGLLPMVLGIPYKSVTWAPMATAFASGLVSATLLTLLLIPAEYILLEGAKIRWRRWRTGNRRQSRPPGGGKTV
jgi:HAE1 family hydrophobic/amphiphilic exporter-1